MEAAVNRKTQPLAVLVCPGIARLTVLSGAAPVGKSYVLSGDLLSVGGRDEDVDFSMDPMVAPKHATIVNRDGAYFIRDEGSSNGVYLRIIDRAQLTLPAIVRVGGQVLHIVSTNDDQPYKWVDGTRLLASPARKGTFAVHQVFEGGTVGASALVSSNFITVGGKGSVLDLGHDPSVSQDHARIFEEDGVVWIEDEGSTNGTYVRIQGETAIEHGDLLWIGQQLVRIDIT